MSSVTGSRRLLLGLLPNLWIPSSNPKMNHGIIRIARRNFVAILLLAMGVGRVSCINFPAEYQEDNQQINFSIFPFTSTDSVPVRDPDVTYQGIDQFIPKQSLSHMRKRSLL